MSEQEKTFQEVVKPAMEWLSKNKNPHAKIIIEATSAELVEGVESFVTDEFISDAVDANPPTCPNCGGLDWHHSVECYLGQDLRPKENITNLRTPQLTFENVLWNGEDQVIVKRILLELVPPEIQKLVIKRFNQVVVESNTEFLEEQKSILLELGAL